MLTAYFDDSGTHDTSGVVVMAGLMGTESQWTDFDQKWRSALAEPLPSKPPLKKFHMTSCQFRRDEFACYSEEESIRVAHRFRRIVFDAEIFGYGIAVSKAEWDKNIQGDMRKALGDAEGHCVRNCILKVLKWFESADIQEEKYVNYVFDKTSNSKIANYNLVYDVFEECYSQSHDEIRPFGISFQIAKFFTPLQGSDIFAWELYRAAQFYLGLNSYPKRKEFDEFIDNPRFEMQIAQGEAIKKIAQMYIDAKTLAQISGLFSVEPID